MAWSEHHPGAVRGNYFVAMPGSVIKAAPEQLRRRTAQKQETDRVVLRDLRRTADVLRGKEFRRHHGTGLARR